MTGFIIIATVDMNIIVLIAIITINIITNTIKSINAINIPNGMIVTMTIGMMTMMTTNTFHHISVTLHLLKKNKANPPPVFRAASWGGQTYETLPYRPSTSHHA